MLTLLQLNNFNCTNLGFDVTNYYKLWGKEHRFSLQVSSCNDTLRDVTERVLCKVKLVHLVSVKVNKHVCFRILSMCVYCTYHLFDLFLVSPCLGS